MQKYTNHSSRHKVHLFRGHVAYVYWIDTVYVQNTCNLSTELRKRQFSLSYDKYEKNKFPESQLVGTQGGG